MSKITLGKKTKFYPSPIFVVGANVDGKPNYSTLCGNIMGMITINIGKNEHNYKGIKDNGTFSLNFPSIDFAKDLDFCGLVSGKNIDKGKHFNTFYGVLKTCPMIKEFPINYECKVINSVDFGSWEMIIGEIIETYSEEKYLKDGWPDIKKINPILYAMPNDYWQVGDYLGHVGIGKELIPNKEI